MKQTNFIAFAFVFLLALSFSSAILVSHSFISPVDGSTVNSSPNIFFNVSVDSSIVAMIYNGETVCTPIAGYCSFSLPNTEFNEGILNTVTFDFVDGGAGFSDSVSFILDTTNPNIYLIGGNVTLTAGETYTDAGATANDSVAGNLTSRINVTNDVNAAVAGTYLVQYNVTDDAGNSAYVNRTVIVNAAEAPRSSGGGGSGGSCNTQWTVSEWSECIGGSQTRTVSYPANYCAPKSDKPLELRTCTMPATTTNTTELESEEDQPNFINTITGNVIGTTAGRWSLGILIFLILVGLAWWIVAAKKRTTVEKPAKKGKK